MDAHQHTHVRAFLLWLPCMRMHMRHDAGRNRGRVWMSVGCDVEPFIHATRMNQTGERLARAFCLSTTRTHTHTLTNTRVCSVCNSSQMVIVLYIYIWVYMCRPSEWTTTLAIFLVHCAVSPGARALSPGYVTGICGHVCVCVCAQFKL